MSKIPFNSVERYSRSIPQIRKIVRTLKNSEYVVDNSFTVNGDAPKKLVRIYSYKKRQGYKKIQINRWPLYIAKTGHKWYPLESVTEFLLNRLAVSFGLNAAESELYIIGGQLRFLSKYFLKRGHEQLVHGAEIFAGYLGDRTLVDQIEKEGLARDLFTLQFVEKSVRYSFPSQTKMIMNELIKLVLFDALVGNNDRHYFNWGVLTSIKSNVQPRFAPIYDTARGLFWNWDEDAMELKMKDKSYFPKYLKKYCQNSKPKLGWEGEVNINHFRLVELIYSNEFFISRDEIKNLFNVNLLKNMLQILDSEFAQYFSPLRLFAVKECLIYRYKIIKEILK